jgi:succinate dehydrogenase / fumarate reductase flavoprotein subunit
MNVPGLRARRSDFLTTAQTRFGASAPQGLADGYFVIPYTIGDYLAQRAAEIHDHDIRTPAARTRSTTAVGQGRGIRGSSPELGRIVGASDGAGPGRRAPQAFRLREEFWHNVSVPARPTT